MGKRGPPPTPTAMLEARGSWRAKLRNGEPTPPCGAPSCPRWLKGDARRAWRHLAPILEAAGILTSIDGNAFARYCQTWSRWRAASEFVGKNGSVYPIKDSSGKTVGSAQFPQVNEQCKLATQLLQLEREFGMTPSSRTNIRTQPTETANRDEFFD